MDYLPQRDGERHHLSVAALDGLLVGRGASTSLEDDRNNDATGPKRARHAGGRESIQIRVAR